MIRKIRKTAFGFCKKFERTIEVERLSKKMNGQ